MLLIKSVLDIVLFVRLFGRSGFFVLSVGCSFGKSPSVGRVFVHTFIRSVGRSVVHSISQLVGHSFVRWVGRSGVRSVVCMFDQSVRRVYVRSFIRSVGRSVIRPIGRVVGWAFGWSFDP